MEIVLISCTYTEEKDSNKPTSLDSTTHQMTEIETIYYQKIENV